MHWHCQNGISSNDLQIQREPQSFRPKPIHATTETPCLAKKGINRYGKKALYPLSLQKLLIPKKKDPSIHEVTQRIVADFWKINEQLEYWSYTLMRIHRIFSKLPATNLLSTLGIWSGYYNITISENSRKYTTFPTEYGKYKFLHVQLNQVQDLWNRIKVLSYHKLLPVNLTWLSQVYGKMSNFPICWFVLEIVCLKKHLCTGSPLIQINIYNGTATIQYQPSTVSSVLYSTGQKKCVLQNNNWKNKIISNKPLHCADTQDGPWTELKRRPRFLNSQKSWQGTERQQHQVQLQKNPYNCSLQQRPKWKF